MSAWKRVAIGKLPEYRDIIQSAESPMSLWIELMYFFEKLYDAPVQDKDKIKKFYEYAEWCLLSPGRGQYSSDAGTAALLAFYEHLPKISRIREDLPNWISYNLFKQLKPVFRYHHSEKIVDSIERNYAEKLVRS
jgi:hypothetical protein